MITIVFGYEYVEDIYIHVESCAGIRDIIILYFNDPARTLSPKKGICVKLRVMSFHKVWFNVKAKIIFCKFKKL